MRLSEEEINTQNRVIVKPPNLSAERKARLDAVAAMPDEQIDYTEAPSLPDAIWTKPVSQAAGTSAPSAPAPASPSPDSI